jgi:hypothetical protein
MECPKCKEKYDIDIYKIDYQYCCDDCSIILYPEDNFGKDA